MYLKLILHFYSKGVKSVLLPCALLHDRADELTNESQELLCVS